MNTEEEAEAKADMHRKHTHPTRETEREYECSPVKVGSPFVKPSRSQEDFLK